MTDIVITIPKASKEEWLEEIKAAKEDKMELLFRVSRPPKDIKYNDRCYVVLDGQVIGYHLIKECENNDGFTCEITDREWREGNYVVRYGSSWTLLKKPIPMKGFQGFRYWKGEKVE